MLAEGGIRRFGPREIDRTRALNFSLSDSLLVLELVHHDPLRYAVSFHESPFMVTILSGL